MQKLPYKQLFKIKSIGKRQISSRLAAAKPELFIRMDPWKVHPTYQTVRQIFSSRLQTNQDEFSARFACLPSYTFVVSLHPLIQKRKQRKIYKRTHSTAHYTRKRLLDPTRSHEHTPSQHVMYHETDEYFIIKTKHSRKILIQKLLQLFVAVLQEENYGSTYRQLASTRRRKLLLSTTDLLGLAPLYMEISGKEYHICPFWGIVYPLLSSDGLIMGFTLVL